MEPQAHRPGSESSLKRAGLIRGAWGASAGLIAGLAIAALFGIWELPSWWWWLGSLAFLVGPLLIAFVGALATRRWGGPFGYRFGFSVLGHSIAAVVTVGIFLGIGVPTIGIPFLGTEGMAFGSVLFGGVFLGLGAWMTSLLIARRLLGRVDLVIIAAILLSLLARWTLSSLFEQRDDEGFDVVLRSLAPWFSVWALLGAGAWTSAGWAVRTSRPRRTRTEPSAPKA